ncbi:hypothetical protein Tco_0553414 [Tanacetum coccineum]
MCMYALTVSTMEPRNFKKAMTDPAWIKSMQVELLQFKRLDVWVLVPPSDNIKPLTLKWLFKNKHDEENTVIQNKTRLVVRKYLKEVKRIFRYLWGTVNMGLWYTKDSCFELTGFSYANYTGYADNAGCKDTFKEYFPWKPNSRQSWLAGSSMKQDCNCAVYCGSRICALFRLVVPKSFGCGHSFNATMVHFIKISNLYCEFEISHSLSMQPGPTLQEQNTFAVR